MALLLADELGDTLVATQRMEELARIAGEALAQLAPREEEGLARARASHLPHERLRQAPARLAREDPRSPREEGGAPQARARTSPATRDAAPLYGPDDLEAIGFDAGARPRRARATPVHARRAAQHVPRPPLDDAPVRRLRHGARVERALPLPARRRGRRGSASPSTCRRRWAATPTTRAPAARWAASAWPSTRSRTCARCSTGLPLDEISTSMTINATAAILLCLYVAVAEEQGVARAALRGTDPERHPQGVHRARDVHLPAAPVAPAHHGHLRVVRARGAAVEHDLDQRLPHPRGGLATPRRSSRSRSPTGSRTCRPRVDAGLDVDSFGAQLSFFFNVHNNLIEEVAKFRAARRMWSASCSERFGAKTDRARALRFHCQTAGMTLTAQQPLDNVARVTVQTLAAVLGGCQSLHTNSFDEALGLPTSEAATIALRTQQIVAHESGVADFVDALAGSYAVESLTTRLEKLRRRVPRAHRRDGRHGRRHRAGLPAARDPAHGVRVPARDRAQGAPHRRRERLHAGGRAGPGARRSTRSIEAEQVERLRAMRARRDAPAHAAALEKVERGRARNGQRPAAHPRGREGVRDGGRDRECAPQRAGASTSRRSSCSKP